MLKGRLNRPGPVMATERSHDLSDRKTVWTYLGSRSFPADSLAVESIGCQVGRQSMHLAAHVKRNGVKKTHFPAGGTIEEFSCVSLGERPLDRYVNRGVGGSEWELRRLGGRAYRRPKSRIQLRESSSQSSSRALSSRSMRTPVPSQSPISSISWRAACEGARLPLRMSMVPGPWRRPS